MMIIFPNAKINLGLNIVSRRADGYHDLETVFYPIGIQDALEVIENRGSEEDVFSQTGIQISGMAENNLAMMALRAMRQIVDFPTVEVHLLKTIPMGAGIGGGSADAAFMLKLLNNKFSLGLSDSELAAMAVKLGADCPFFVYNRPMFAGGVGELLEDIGLSLDEYSLVLIKPDVFISTREAFAHVVPKEPAVSLKEIIRRPVEEWKGLLTNDFESSIFPQFPQIKWIKETLYEAGAVYASMSGSGASVYGLFKNKPENIKSTFPGCYVWQQD